ncbi:MAG: hypothetical protein ACTHN5_15900 [Phycisphaerae bacterium]
MAGVAVRSRFKRCFRSSVLQRCALDSLEPRILLTAVIPASKLMYHNDPYSTGDNLNETLLTPANVNSTDFGLVARTTLDGQVYAQPLVVPNVNVTRGSSPGIHNVVYAATQNDSLYAIDANTGTVLWKDSFLNIVDPTSPTATPGVSVIPAGSSFGFNALVNGSDVGPELGIIATPVINPANNVMYLVTYTMEKRQGSTPFASSTNPGPGVGFDTHYVERLWAINLTDGTAAITPANSPLEPPSGGQVIGDTIYNSTSFSSYNGYQYVVGPYIKGSGDNGTYVPGTGGSAPRDGWTPNPTDTSTPWGTAGSTPQAQGYIAFNALLQMSRTGMTLLNGNLYMGFASHGDDGPYYGWVLGYSATTLQNTAAFVTAPTFESFSTVSGNRSQFISQAGVWMSGGSLVNDGTYLYMTTGNGAFNVNASNFSAGDFTLDNGHVVQLPIDGDFGDSLIKLAIDPAADQSSLDLTALPTTFQPNGKNLNGYGLKIQDFFTPSNALYMNFKDEDLGSGGVLLLPDNITATVPGHVGDHMLVTGGKEGRIYLIDRDNLGGFNTSYPSPTNGSTPVIGPDPSPYDRVLGEYSVNGVDVQSNQFYSTASYVFDGANPLFFEALAGKPVWQFNATTFQAAQSPPNSASANTPIHSSSVSFPKRGATMSISANGTSNIILWGLNVNLSSSDSLVAFAASLGSPLYQSTSVSGDALPGTASGATGVKFSSPTVVNGLVYAGTGGGSGSSAFAEGTLAIYGLRATYLNSNGTLFGAPSNLTTLRTPAGVQLNWTRHSTAEAAVEIDRSTDGTHWSTLTYLANGSDSYIDATAAFPQQYLYRVRAVNGPSLTAFSNAATAPAVLAGDANVDGKVDLSDLSVVLNHFGMATSAWTDGNFDGAATINLTDLSDVLNHFGTTSVLTGAAVAEPASTNGGGVITTPQTSPSAAPLTTPVQPVDTSLVSATTVADVGTTVVPVAAPVAASEPAVLPPVPPTTPPHHAAAAPSHAIRPAKKHKPAHPPARARHVTHPFMSHVMLLRWRMK